MDTKASGLTDLPSEAQLICPTLSTTPLTRRTTPLHYGFHLLLLRQALHMHQVLLRPQLLSPLRLLPSTRPSLSPPLPTINTLCTNILSTPHPASTCPPPLTLNTPDTPDAHDHDGTVIEHHGCTYHQDRRPLNQATGAHGVSTKIKEVKNAQKSIERRTEEGGREKGMLGLVGMMYGAYAISCA